MPYIRQVLGCNPNYISRWKGRFEAERLAGLYSHHPGRAVEKRIHTTRNDCLRFEIKRTGPSGKPEHQGGYQRELDYANRRYGRTEAQFPDPTAPSAAGIARPLLREPERRTLQSSPHHLPAAIRCIISGDRRAARVLRVAGELSTNNWARANVVSARPSQLTSPPQPAVWSLLRSIWPGSAPVQTLSSNVT